MTRKAVASSPRHVIASRAKTQRTPLPCPRPYSEPTDSFEDANEALDQIERCVDRVLAAGGEFALRRRLAQALGPGELIEVSRGT